MHCQLFAEDSRAPSSSYQLDMVIPLAPQVRGIRSLSKHRCVPKYTNNLYGGGGKLPPLSIVRHTDAHGPREPGARAQAAGLDGTQLVKSTIVNLVMCSTIVFRPVTPALAKRVQCRVELANGWLPNPSTCSFKNTANLLYHLLHAPLVVPCRLFGPRVCYVVSCASLAGSNASRFTPSRGKFLDRQELSCL